MVPEVNKHIFIEFLKIIEVHSLNKLPKITFNVR